MDSITLQEQLLIDQYLADELTKAASNEFKAALKAPNFAEAVALQRDLQDYLLGEPERSPLKEIFGEIAAKQRRGK